MRFRLNLATSLILISAMGFTVNAREIAFQRDIAPIFAKHCADCHAGDQSEGGLQLDRRQFAFATNDSGKRAIVPGDVAKSELLQRLTSTDDELRMPPDAEPLPKQQIALITKWIEQGASWPAAPQSKLHWSYVPPTRPTLPPSQSGWPHNEIDCFIEAQLAKHQLSPSQLANPARLIRRVHLDLIGLPPSTKVVAEFVADPSDTAYENVVNELLASPRYGEKWARRWLDLARYSDSNGYQADQLRDMWAYRDWVIHAMNEDMPFDQFTIEQIAGDLLPDSGLSHRIATGFHRTPTCNVEAGVDPEGNRTDQVIDRVNTTGIVWLGTTFECAQCHNHKYDPITQREYYQMFAFFNNTPIEVTKFNNANGVRFDFYGPKLELPMADRKTRLRALLDHKIETAERQLDAARKKGKPNLIAWEDLLSEETREQLPENVQTALAQPRGHRTKPQQDSILENFLNHQPDVQSAKQSLSQLRTEHDALAPDSTLVMVEMTARRETRIFLRGEFLNTGESVKPGVPSVLHALSAPQPTRLDLAKWLVSRDNPLVARVTVNRWWQELFGRGLVTTVEDFGTQGEPASHPALLDWLAVEFMDKGWSMKHIHRLIVTSTAYRQTARASSSQRRVDPENRWLSYGPRNRMPAEMIRDNALAVSGLLVNELGGAPIYPPQPDGLWHQTGRNEPVYLASQNGNRFRRGVYVIWRRAAPYPSFVNFDAPDRMTCTVQRPRTNTPLQALTLLNDQAYTEAAQAFAINVMSQRVLNTNSPSTHLPSIDVERIEYAFEKCLSRGPSPQEKDILLTELAAARDAMPNESTIQGVVEQLPFDLPVDIDRKEWWAWYSVTNVLLNLDETITK